MQWLFCWRCGCDMPMLDETEYAELHRLYREGIRLRKQVAGQDDHPMRGAKIEEFLQ